MLDGITLEGVSESDFCLKSAIDIAALAVKKGPVTLCSTLYQLISENRRLKRDLLQLKEEFANFSKQCNCENVFIKEYLSEPISLSSREVEEHSTTYNNSTTEHIYCKPQLSQDPRTCIDSCPLSNIEGDNNHFCNEASIHSRNGVFHIPNVCSNITQTKYPDICTSLNMSLNKFIQEDRCTSVPYLNAGRISIANIYDTTTQWNGHKSLHSNCNTLQVGNQLEVNQGSQACKDEIVTTSHRSLDSSARTGISDTLNRVVSLTVAQVHSPADTLGSTDSLSQKESLQSSSVSQLNTVDDEDSIYAPFPLEGCECLTCHKTLLAHPNTPPYTLYDECEKPLVMAGSRVTVLAPPLLPRTHDESCATPATANTPHSVDVYNTTPATANIPHRFDVYEQVTGSLPRTASKESSPQVLKEVQATAVYFGHPRNTSQDNLTRSAPVGVTALFDDGVERFVSLDNYLLGEDESIDGSSTCTSTGDCVHTDRERDSRVKDVITCESRSEHNFTDFGSDVISEEGITAPSRIASKAGLKCFSSAASSCSSVSGGSHNLDCLSLCAEEMSRYDDQFVDSGQWADVGHNNEAFEDVARDGSTPPSEMATMNANDVKLDFHDISLYESSDSAIGVSFTNSLQSGTWNSMKDAQHTFPHGKCVLSEHEPRLRHDSQSIQIDDSDSDDSCLPGSSDGSKQPSVFGADVINRAIKILRRNSSVDIHQGHNVSNI